MFAADGPPLHGRSPRHAVETDLDDKQWVIQVVDPASGALCGFSTQRMLDGEAEGRPIKALFSGDTIVDREPIGAIRRWPAFGGRLAADADRGMARCRALLVSLLAGIPDVSLPAGFLPRIPSPFRPADAAARPGRARCAGAAKVSPRFRSGQRPGSHANRHQYRLRHELGEYDRRAASRSARAVLRRAQSAVSFGGRALLPRAVDAGEFHGRGLSRDRFRGHAGGVTDGAGILA